MAVLADRPVATIAAILAPALLVVIERASNLTVFDLGAIVGPVDSEWWRYFAAPFVYDDIGYLFACGLAIAIFVPGIESRLGAIPAALLIVGAGALGMLAADGVDTESPWPWRPSCCCSCRSSRTSPTRGPAWRAVWWAAPAGSPRRSAAAPTSAREQVHRAHRRAPRLPGRARSA
jgi:membrane associated rhomboid family serine protease